MWTIVLSVSALITLSMSLAFCLCWRKKTEKDEWLGLDGMVTQKNPDENVNHLPSAAACVVDGVTVVDSNNDKRNVPTTNSRRSLPDIPSEQVATVNWEAPCDNSSEHYATVGHYQQNNAKSNNLPNGIEARPSISQHSSISQADDTFSPYERVKYDKIKNKEHPYAQLQPTTSRGIIEENPSVIVEERISLLRPDALNTATEPAAPPRSRRSSTNSGLTVDIPAASAVAGGIAASPELPYMTPPVTQSNFSGDSQDSSKGYTSISVREPLANIRAQTKEINKKRTQIYPHYSTGSDDSDDVYTTIPDPNNQIYTSESETYARIPSIPITVEAEVNQPPTLLRRNDNAVVGGGGSDEGNAVGNDDDDDDGVGDGLYATPQPPLPSVDSLKQVAHSHSRQASSSSSIANIGSPKPEKRQANSPLPPPPTATSFDFHSDKIAQQKNLDDLYAKVHKTKKNSDEEEIIIDNKKSIVKDHNYETLRKSNDPGYEKIRNNEEPGYASINGPDSITSSDPGYEVLKQKDPNYEELRQKNDYSNINDTNLMDGYSVVNKNNKKIDKELHDPNIDEPNYESMPNESISKHNYDAINTGSDTDPNYESVSQNDPNYESVSDPPYERLHDGNNEIDNNLIGYETIKRGYVNIDTSESSNGDRISICTDPPYEKLNNEEDNEKINESNYSTINKNNNNNNNLLDDDTIFQV